MADTSVRYFDSTMSGAPSLSGTAGTLISVLNACLVNGFGSVTLSSLVVSSNVATATVSGGHNLQMIVGVNSVSPGVGPVIRIAGATPSSLNGDWRIASVPTSTTFTFATTGISDQTATGTITAKRAPAGFTLAYSGTNTAAYSRSIGSATAMLLSIDDTPAQYPALVMYEVMTAVLTGTGPAPASGSFYTAKSTTANSTARPWRLFADQYAFYFFAQPDSAIWATSLFFGDIIPYKSGDQYHCGLIANSVANTASYIYQLAGATNAALLSRDSTQTGSPVVLGRYSHQRSGAQMGVAGNPYPALDGAVHCCPVEAWESSVGARGLMPGLYNPLHAVQPPDSYLVDNIPQLPGRQLLAVLPGSNSYRALIDIVGPWR